MLRPSLQTRSTYKEEVEWKSWFVNRKLHIPYLVHVRQRPFGLHSIYSPISVGPIAGRATGPTREPQTVVVD